MGHRSRLLGCRIRQSSRKLVGRPVGRATLSISSTAGFLGVTHAQALILVQQDMDLLQVVPAAVM